MMRWLLAVLLFFVVGAAHAQQPAYPSSTSPSTVYLGQQQMQVVLDSPAGFLVGQIVRIDAPDNQWVTCSIVALDINGNMTCNYWGGINGGNGYFSNLIVSVIGGPWTQSVQAAISFDTTTNFAEPQVGDVLSLTVDKGKAFTGTAQVYFQAISDYTAWFMCTVITYSILTGALSCIVTQSSWTAGLYCPGLQLDYSNTTGCYAVGVALGLP